MPGAKSIHSVLHPYRSGVKRRWVWAVVCLALIAGGATLVALSPQARRQRWERMSLARLRQEAARRAHDPEIHLLLGWRLRRMGDKTAAFEAIFKAYEMRRLDPVYMAAMAAANMDANDDAAAAELLRSASVRAPNSPEVLAQQAHLQLKHGRFADALRTARRAVEFGRHLPEAWQALGRACAAEKQADEAFRAFERALRLAPDDVDALTDYGEALARFGRFKQAETILRRALRLAPRAPRPLGILGAQLAARAATVTERTEAASLLQRAIDAAPQEPDPRYHLGMLYLRQGRMTDAIEQLKTCLELDPGYGEAHDGLGRAYTLLGQREEAQRHFVAFQRFTDYRREASHLELRLRRAPRDVNLLLRAARLHERYGAIPSAILYYRRALDVRPDAKLEQHVRKLGNWETGKLGN
ncbi:MAG: tetratricopeptide repeat protein [Abditibacteriales bacterium]|nr:tetratricopeptide repeat protein [Abditibacteriales bacterium]